MSSYIPYQPISKKGDSNTYVSPELGLAQKIGFQSLPAHIVDDWDSIVATYLGINVESMWNLFSSEQIDSIGLAIRNIEAGKQFIVSDETGIGKGRILSGICKWAFKNNRKVLFFTEKEHLFSDFWRDLTHTETTSAIKQPIILHPSSKIYNEDGSLAIKGGGKIIKDIEANGFNPETNFCVASYSQFSLKKHQDDRLTSIKNYIKGNILILDESQNATGDSNTNASILAIKSAAYGCVFSSATFIKTESNIDLYQDVLGIADDGISLLKSLLRMEDEVSLRKDITIELSKQLKMLRREHKPIEVDWQILTCKDEDSMGGDRNKILNSLSAMVDEIFHITQQLSAIPEIGETAIKTAWYGLGATVNRLFRNIVLLSKIPKLILHIKQNVAEQKKPVIVIDSTFASMLEKIGAYQLETLGLEQAQYTLEYAVRFLIHESIEKFITDQLIHIPSEITSSIEAIKFKTSEFKSITMSPIDTIGQELAKYGISSDEISGRTFYITEDGERKNRAKKPKQIITSSFNSGDTNVLIITRAGASGISLHSSSTFKNQNTRVLYELEITTRPDDRVQFIGRVKRRGQVCDPEFISVVTDILFEQRILNLEKQKLHRLQTHVGARKNNAPVEHVPDFYTDFCNKCVYDYLLRHPNLSLKMGIRMNNLSESFYYVDNTLKRSVILDSSTQSDLLELLKHACLVQGLFEYNAISRTPIESKEQSLGTFWHNIQAKDHTAVREVRMNDPIGWLGQFQYPWVGNLLTKNQYASSPVDGSLFVFEAKNKIDDTAYCQSVRQNILKLLSNTTLVPHEKNIIQSIHIGSKIAIKSFSDVIVGHIYDVIAPNIKDSFSYPNLWVIHIKSENPSTQGKINAYPGFDYYISIKDLSELNESCIRIKQYDPNDLVASKYHRNGDPIIQDRHYFVGHPIYLELMRQSYNLLPAETLNLQDKPVSAVPLFLGANTENIKSLPKPIYKALDVFDYMSSHEYAEIGTDYKNSAETSSAIKLTKNQKWFLLSVSPFVKNNKKIFDFSVKAMMDCWSGRSHGYDHYTISHKKYKRLIFLLEARGLIWFPKPLNI